MTHGHEPSGVGIGLRRSHFDALPSVERRVDWLEFVPENFVGVGGKTRDVLARCAERWTLVPHGVSLGAGNPDPLDGAYVRGLKALLDDIDAAYYSDHLCYQSIGGTSYHDLLPLPFTDEAVRACAARIVELADRLERPIAVENISFYAVMPGSVMTETAFVSAVVNEARCGLLLDVNNVYVNACNHGLDPLECLEGLPLEHAMHIHLAGHVDEDGRLIDNHGTAVPDPVWALYEHAVAHVGPVPTLVEWDTSIPPLPRVLDEADKARARAQAALVDLGDARERVG